MALQLSVTLRDNQAAQVEATLGTTPHLHIRSGAPPANCAAADSGTLLANLTLPSDWLGAPSAGAVSKSGTWQDLSADATGVAAHWRLKEVTETTTHAQGTVTATGGGGDMTVDNVNFAAAQSFTVNTFTWTIPNA